MSGPSDVFVVKLAEDVHSLLVDAIARVESFNVNQGIASSLDAKLLSAQAALAAARANSVGTACNQLGAFINATRAQSGKGLTVDQANQLIAAAEQITAALGCPR